MSLPQYTFYSRTSRRVRLCVLRPILHQFMYSEKSAVGPEKRDVRRTLALFAVYEIISYKYALLGLYSYF
jgi:hypothetical protein